MYFIVDIDWKGNILGIDGMQPSFESTQIPILWAKEEKIKSARGKFIY
jgi:hypothetical protein